MTEQFITSNIAYSFILYFKNIQKLQNCNKLLQTVWQNKSFCILNVSSRNGIMMYCVVGHCEQMDILEY